MAPGLQDVKDDLARLGRSADDILGLGRTALALAALQRPRLALPQGALADPEPFARHLALLAEDLAESGAETHGAENRARCLAELMARRHGYQAEDAGDEDDEGSAANLMWVIEQRRGGAVALGILYLEAARGAGWLAEPLAFPDHFLVRLEDLEGRRVIVDPLAGGKPVDSRDMRALLKASAGMQAELEPALYAPLSNREVLVRLQNDVKMRLLKGGRIANALAVVEATLLVAPDCASLWREAGLMHVRMENLGAAVAALEQFIARTDNAQARARTLSLLQELKGRMT